MNIKKIFNGPIVWIAVGLLLVSLAFSAFNTPSVQRVETHQGLELLTGDTVEHALVVDGEQRVELELSEPYVTDAGTEEEHDHGERVEFFYVEPQGDTVTEAVTAADPPDGFDSEVPQPSFWGSMLSFIIPFLIIGVVFWFILSRMQGGGSRVMGFGK